MVRESIISLLVKQSEYSGKIEEGPTPLYHQLYALLKCHIVDGTIGYGSQLPTEQELGEAFDLSRITVKRALDELAHENLVERRRGRGTTVVYKFEPKPAKAPMVCLLQCLESTHGNNVMQTLDCTELEPPAAIRQELGLAETDMATRLTRLRLTEDGTQVIAYYLGWSAIPAKRFTRAALQQLTGAKLLQAQGFEVAREEQLISAEAATPAIAEQLGVKPDTALLVLVRRSYDEQGRLVNILRSSYNPAVFQLQVSVELDQGVAPTM